MAKYAIFGAGPSGLYTAWRLITSGKLSADDSLTIYEWGDYNFSGHDSHLRPPAGRICSYPYKNNPLNTHLEVGGMRYMKWDPSDPRGTGHRLVSHLVRHFQLAEHPFCLTEDPLYYLRGKHMYASEISKTSPAPYNTPYASQIPAVVFDDVAKKIVGKKDVSTRQQQCEFYEAANLEETLPSQSHLSEEAIHNTAYWNVMYDLVGSEGYQYAADAGGYSSNVINWNTADAVVYNNEFLPGGKFYTLTHGFSHLFKKIFHNIVEISSQKGISFFYSPQTKLEGLYIENGGIAFRIEKGAQAEKNKDVGHADYAFLCMPKRALELVAQGTRYHLGPKQKDILNSGNVPYWLQSVIQQPSNKIGMFFSHPWWEEAPHQPKVNPEKNIYGPTVTDIPLRQIYYFGNNGQKKSPVFGILASYDDGSNVDFWREMELGDTEYTTAPEKRYTAMNLPPRPSKRMINMVRAQLAEVHFGKGASMDCVPMPLETVYMDWGNDPYGAGYHAWSAHYNICKAMDSVRKPTQTIPDAEANVFIVGSTYSNDQAWVEGAFCTAESVLVPRI